MNQAWLAVAPRWPKLLEALGRCHLRELDRWLGGVRFSVTCDLSALFEENIMLFTMRHIAWLCLSSAFAYGGTWSGTLVDSKCFAIAELNVNPTDTLTYVDRDQNQELRLCSPSAKTKSFAVVQHDGRSFNLDSAGNAKAAELLRTTAKKSTLAVVVTGEMNGKAIKVDTISMDR